MRIIGKFLKNFVLIAIMIGLLFGILTGLMQTAFFISEYYNSLFAGMLVLLLPVAVIFAIAATTADEAKKTND